MRRWATALVAFLILIVPPCSQGRSWIDSEANDDKQEVNPNPPRSLSVTVKAARKEFHQLDPVILSVEIKNPAASDCYAILGNGPYKYKAIILIVTDGDGCSMPPTVYHLVGLVSPVGGSGPEGKYLRPSESVRSEIVANLIRDMSRPSEYTIVVEIRFLLGCGFSNLEPAVARSEPLKVRIIERP